MKEKNYKLDRLKIERVFRRHISWWFIAPTIIVLAIIVMYPMIYSLSLCFHTWYLASPGGKVFCGFDNFVEVINDVDFFRSLERTAIFVTASVGLQLLIGLGLALLLVGEKKSTKIMRSLLVLPVIIAPVVGGITWRFMLDNEFGVVSYYLRRLGIITVPLLSNPGTAMASIILADVWKWTPFVMFILVAALAAVPPDQVEAAKVDGASEGQVLRHIILPFIKPVIIVIILIRMIDAINIFDVIFVMTGGGPGRASEVLSMLTYKKGFMFFHMGSAATLSYIMVILTMMISVLLMSKSKILE